MRFLKVRVPAGAEYWLWRSPGIDFEGLLSAVPALRSLFLSFDDHCCASQVANTIASIGHLSSLTTLRVTVHGRIGGHLGTWNLPHLRVLHYKQLPSVDINAPVPDFAHDSIARVVDVRPCSSLTELSTNADDDLFSALEYGAWPGLQCLDVHLWYQPADRLLAALHAQPRALVHVGWEMHERGQRVTLLQQFLQAHPTLESLSCSAELDSTEAPFVAASVRQLCIGFCNEDFFRSMSFPSLKRLQFEGLSRESLSSLDVVFAACPTVTALSLNGADFESLSAPSNMRAPLQTLERRSTCARMRTTASD